MDNEKAKQTGPRSEAGKATSSRNALKHGVYSKARILPGEDPAELDQLTADYYSHFHPANPPERKLVDDLIHAEWLLRRLNRIDTEILEDGMRPNYKGEPRTSGEAFVNAGQVELRLQRRIDSTDRLYRRSLDQLRQLQKERPAAPSGPVETEAEPAITPVESVLGTEPDFVSSTPEIAPVCPPGLPEAAPEGRPLGRRLTISEMRELMERKLEEDNPDWKPAA